MVIEVVFPEGMKPLKILSKIKGKIEGQKVKFVPVRSDPKGHHNYIIKVKALQAGDKRIRAFLSSDMLRRPVAEEESTYVY